MSLSNCRACRVFARLGAGTDRLDVAAAMRCGIVVANVPDFCVNEQAEHTLALLLALARQLPHCDGGAAPRRLRGAPSSRRPPSCRPHARPGRLRRQRPRRGPEGGGLRPASARLGTQPGQTPGGGRILRRGTGRVGAAVEGERFCLSAPAADRQHAPLAGRRPAVPDEAERRTHQYGPRRLVDEQALVEALRRKSIAGAALDVFENIDVFAVDAAPPQHPLLELDNVLLTPQYAGSSVESTRESKLRGRRPLPTCFSAAGRHTSSTPRCGRASRCNPGEAEDNS